MASIQYSGAVQRSQKNEPIFSGMKFQLAADVPQRSYYKEKIENHGGAIVKQQDDQTYIIVDHMKKKRIQHVNAYSYKFIDASIRDGKVSDDPTLSVGIPVANRSVGDPTVARRAVKLPYTKEEDVWLWDYVMEKTAEGKFTDKGNGIYQEIERIRPRHTWQSWRDHYIKQLKGKPRPVPLQNVGQSQSEAPATGPQHTSTGGEASSSMPRLSSQDQTVAQSSEVYEATPSTAAPQKRKRRGMAQVATQPADEAAPSEAAPAENTHTDETATPRAKVRKIVTSQTRGTSEIPTTAEELLFLYEHADGILHIDPDRTEECWQALAQRPGFENHSAEAWQIIWQKLVLPKIMKIRSVNIDTLPSGVEDEHTAEANSERKAKSSGLNKANTKRRLTTGQNNGSSSQSQSQSQPSNSGQGMNNVQPTSQEEHTSNEDTQETPRPAKRVKTVHSRQDDPREQATGRETLDTNESKQSASHQNTSSQTPSTEESLTQSTQESTQDRVDAQLMSSIEHNPLEQQPGSMENEPDRPDHRTEARAVDKGEEAEDRDENGKVSSEAGDERLHDEPDGSTWPLRSAEDTLKDGLTPYLFDADTLAMTRTQTDSQALTATTPGNTAPIEPYPTSSNKDHSNSSKEQSSMQSLIVATQPGYTSQIEASSPPRGHKTSPIDSSAESPAVWQDSSEEARTEASEEITDGRGNEVIYSSVEASEEDDIGGSGGSQADPRPWIKDKVQQGFAIDSVTMALNAATGYTDLAELALNYLSRHGELPVRLRGVFTAKDDEDLQSQDARRIARVQKKHGRALAHMRLHEWLVS